MQKIVLNDKYLISVGTNRACYTHPNDKLKCIKVNISDNLKETEREIRYYRYLQKKDVSWDMLAKFHGTIQTNIGEGEVVELVRDFDGNVSKQLGYSLKNNKNKEYIISQIEILRKYLIDERIVVKDLNTANIVYQQYTEKTGRLVIIDGLNNKVFFNIDYLVLKKINKIWTVFFNSLQPLLKD
jgi:hypothetical protein